MQVADGLIFHLLFSQCFEFHLPLDQSRWLTSFAHFECEGLTRANRVQDTELITAVAVGPEGRNVFSASRSLQAKWWDKETGECRRSWKAHDGPVADMAVDASGGLLATASTDRR